MYIKAILFKGIILFLLISICLEHIGCDAKFKISEDVSGGSNMLTVKLPEVRHKSDISLEECLVKRRSIRSFNKLPLTIEDISQLAWAGQGMTASWGGRTSPSAGALYPLESYFVIGNVAGLDNGIYHYLVETHELELLKKGDFRIELSSAALNQSCVRDAPVSVIITAIYERTTIKYGDRGVRYVHIEAGHAAQNILLQAVALGLGSVPVGAFYDDKVANLLSIPKNEVPLYIIPVGKY